MNAIDILPGLRWLAGLALLLAAGLPSAPTLAQAQDARLQAAMACAEETSRLARLECYDALFHERDDAVAAEPRSSLWQAVIDQEAERDAEAFGLLVRETADTVLMSVPALGTVPPRPLLVISCDDVITRFQLHLSELLQSPHAPLRLQGDGISLSQTWRVLEDGHVVSGGRGLPAIGTLKRLLGSEQLTLSSQLAPLDGLRFDLRGLRTAIEPLRAMCRW
ncbi:type VI secretion system-associated protein TagO [Billgrantia azerbaijanica]|nr:type VI secretion system-associated protein TagO [Halomonas azerbaijanica]